MGLYSSAISWPFEVGRSLLWLCFDKLALLLTRICWFFDELVVNFLLSVLFSSYSSGSLEACSWRAKILEDCYSFEEMPHLEPILLSLDVAASIVIKVPLFVCYWSCWFCIVAMDLPPPTWLWLVPPPLVAEQLFPPLFGGNCCYVLWFEFDGSDAYSNSCSCLSCCTSSFGSHIDSLYSSYLVL